jgi:SecD/SecF fusion protein
LALFIKGFAYALSFTFIVNKKESDITKKDSNPKEVKDKLDDLYNSQEPLKLEPWTRLWLTDYEYKRAKQNSLNLGLDLKGGMSALLEVSQRDIIEKLSRRYKSDKDYLEILDNLKESGADTYLVDFEEEFAKKNESLSEKDKLDLIDVFTQNGNPNFESEEELIKWLEDKLESTYNLTFESLKRRLDQFGLSNPNIQKIEKNRQILIELPGMTDKTMVEDYLSATGSLEFWKGIRIQDLYEEIPTIFNEEFLSIANLPCTYQNGQGIGFPCTDTIVDAPNLFTSLGDNNAVFPGGPAIANIVNDPDSVDSARLYFDELSKELNNKYLFYFTNSPQEVSKSSSNIEDDRYIQVIALDNSKGPVLTGESVESARQERDQTGRPTIGMTMTTSGASKWSAVTDELKPDGEKPADYVAIVLDKEVYSYPTVRSQLGFNSEITGTLI